MRRGIDRTVGRRVTCTNTPSQPSDAQFASCRLGLHRRLVEDTAKHADEIVGLYRAYRPNLTASAWLARGCDDERTRESSQNRGRILPSLRLLV